MSSTTENSFSAKLSKAQNLAQVVSQFADYAPLREQETIPLFREFLTSTQTNSNKISISYKEYKEAVDLRQFHYKDSPTSVVKIVAQIKAAIEALYGKKSTESTIVNGIIKEMRDTKVIKVPAVQDLEKDTIKAETTFSMSQKSYGSQVEFLNRIVNTLENLSTYNPTNKDIKVDSLKNFVAFAQNLNLAVYSKIQPLKDAQLDRLKAYTELGDRVQRIKQSVKAQYGIKSNEYIMIKGM